MSEPKLFSISELYAQVRQLSALNKQLLAENQKLKQLIADLHGAINNTVSDLQDSAKELSEWKTKVKEVRDAGSF